MSSTVPSVLSQWIPKDVVNSLIMPFCHSIVTTAADRVLKETVLDQLIRFYTARELEQKHSYFVCAWDEYEEQHQRVCSECIRAGYRLPLGCLRPSPNCVGRDEHSCIACSTTYSIGYHDWNEHRVANSRWRYCGRCFEHLAWASRQWDIRTDESDAVNSFHWSNRNALSDDGEFCDLEQSAMNAKRRKLN